jgi:hypothetical protein
MVRGATDPTQPGENAVDDLSIIGCQAVETIVKKTVVFLSPQGSVPFLKLTISVAQKGRKGKLRVY